MAEKLINLKRLYDQSDQEAAFAIRDALAPIINKTVSSGTLFPNCPLNGSQHFLEPDQQTYYYDQTRNLWLSQETYPVDFGRRNNVGNNVLLRTTDASFTGTSGVPIPFDNETLLWGMSADWSNTLVTANLQVQSNAIATVYTLATANVSYDTDFSISAPFAAGQEYITVRTNGLSANMLRPQVTLYLKRYKPVI